MFKTKNLHKLALFSMSALLLVSLGNSALVNANASHRHYHNRIHRVYRKHAKRHIRKHTRKHIYKIDRRKFKSKQQAIKYNMKSGMVSYQNVNRKQYYQAKSVLTKELRTMQNEAKVAQMINNYDKKHNHNILYAMYDKKPIKSNYAKKLIRKYNNLEKLDTKVSHQVTYLEAEDSLNPNSKAYRYPSPFLATHDGIGEYNKGICGKIMTKINNLYNHHNTFIEN